MATFITEKVIGFIEAALGIELYEYQKKYLLGEYVATWGRASGRTTAYCIKLALTSGPPLNLLNPSSFSDGMGGTAYDEYIFKPQFLDIWHKLKAAGFTVRQLKEGKKLYD